MSDLSKFSEQERVFIASIPYRVGVWISNVDDNARSQIDDREERKALEATITSLAAKNNKIPFAAAIMAEVEKRKASWPSWDGISGEDKVLGDTQKALQLCKSKITEKELAQYKQTIWRVGMIVAQAYGEHIDPDNEMHVDRLFQWIGSMTGGAKLGKNPENMSKQEKNALNKLRAILKNT